MGVRWALVISALFGQPEVPTGLRWTATAAGPETGPVWVSGRGRASAGRSGMPATGSHATNRCTGFGRAARIASSMWARPGSMTKIFERQLFRIQAIAELTTDRACNIVHLIYQRSEEHTSELQSLMRISYAVFCLKKKKKQAQN